MKSNWAFYISFNEIRSIMMTASKKTLPRQTFVSYRTNKLFNLSGIFLNQIIQDASLTVLCPDYNLELSAGRNKREHYIITIDQPETLWRMTTNPDPGAGELFMEGKWNMEHGDIGAFLTMMARNLQNLLNGKAGFFLSAFLKKNLQKRQWDIAHSKSHAQYHYDIGNDLYETFLDFGMNYSCAFFDHPDMSLRDAQLNKIRTTIKRLGIGLDMDVLDIGCGWGEACSVIAQETGAVTVTGITLAHNQLMIARSRIKNTNSSLSYHLEDYREHAARKPAAYDRILSIGMFEHVGEKNYNSFFANIRNQLKPDGKALIHSILDASGQAGRGMINGPWLERYIFPGGRIPHISEMITAAWEENLKLAYPPYLQPPSDYAQTLRHWRNNFMRNMPTLNRKRYGERFRRMWIYYLAMCEAMFDGCGFQVGQLVFEHR
jgi:cyclopropane-fatty-acyl-phospholipid synthase